MKEDWLKDIHNKMADYEVDEPRGLWDDIYEARQQLEEETKTVKRSKAVVWLWTKRATAVAAMVIFVISVGYFTKKDKKLPSIAFTATEVKVANTGKDKQATSLPDKTRGEWVASAENICFKTSEKRKLEETIPSVQASTEVIADTASATDKHTPEPEQQTSEDTSDTRQHKQQHRYDKDNRGAYRNNYIAHTNIGKDKSGRLSCGVFMTGGASAALDKKSIGDISVGIGPDDADWADSPLLGILLYNQGKEVKTDIKHRLPIRAGVSFAYKINERLSLESGVTYTNLTSDMREGSDSHYFTGEQTLHYVGIPLNMKCDIVSWKGLELYASAGLLAEKCVSGNQKKEYVLNNKVEKKETQDLNEKPFQWSVNASAGLQYNVSSSIGIYAEPGVSYYFNDGTSIKTIYKDKPFNFNLNLGLRFTFRNK